jgi:hypothetical protein
VDVMKKKKRVKKQQGEIDAEWENVQEEKRKFYVPG